MSQGKLAFHTECRKLWTPCEHMRTVTNQLEEYTRAVADGDGIPLVPEGCIPLIGYTKKPSTLLDITLNGRNFLEERQLALKTYKKNHKIKWYHTQKKKKTYQHIAKDKTFVVGETRPKTLLQLENAVEDVLDSTMVQYFSVIKKIENSDDDEVSVLYIQSKSY